MQKIFRAYVPVLFGFLFVAACKKLDNGAYTANIAVSHFIINADSVNLLYDDNRITGNPSLSYGVTTMFNGQCYVKTGAGTHNVKVVTGSTVLQEKNLTTTAGNHYSLILYDSLKNGAIKAALLTDIITPIDTLAQVRFINTVPGTDTLTISFDKDTVLNTTDVYIGRKSNPSSGFVSRRPGSWKVSLLRGTAVIIQPVAFQLVKGKLYSFIAGGIKGGTGKYRESLVMVSNN